MKRILISLLTLIVFSTTQANDTPAAIVLNPYPGKIGVLKDEIKIFEKDLKNSYDSNDYRNNICQIITNYSNQILVSIQYLDQYEAQVNFEEVQKELVRIQVDNKERNIDCYKRPDDNI